MNSITAPGRLKLPNFVSGQSVESSTNEWREVRNPSSQEVVALVPMAKVEEVDSAVAAAKAAFTTWRYSPLPVRMRAMHKLLQLVQQNAALLAETVSREQGKTLPDAEGEVARGIECIEQACSIANLQLGELVENIATGVDTFSLLQPLGVGVGITPFNFPMMTPCYMFPLAIACGNTFVLKPSETNPGAALILARLAKEAGLPDGVLNVVHGSHDVVNQLCDHPDVRAIHIIGSSQAGKHVHERAGRSGKRVNAMMGAKNHMVIMGDASKEQAINALLGSAFGAAGQRCMANSVVVLVGRAAQWLPEIIARAKTLKVGPHTDSSADLAAVTSVAAKERILGLIESGVSQGATLALDGRGIKVDGFESGNFIGPTIFTEVRPDQDIYRQEIFGPVLCVMTAETLDQAITIVNANPHGNGTAIFTSSGWAARKYQSEVDVGQVGINLPVPVPPTNFSFNGSRGSKRGDLGPNGKQGVLFWTQTKIVMSRWIEPDAGSNELNTTIALKV
jgi:malonate-semialdehyde dehydrogenase (acetylating) / methylmalonate-semialdehyde dehydrogenase